MCPSFTASSDFGYAMELHSFLTVTDGIAEHLWQSDHAPITFLLFFFPQSVFMAFIFAQLISS